MSVKGDVLEPQKLVVLISTVTVFYGLAVKTGSKALQKFLILFIYFFFPTLKFIFLAQVFFSTSASKI